MAAFSLNPDCKNCVAFCCVAFAFDQGEHFDFDKAAGVACPHLLPDHYCRIHAQLDQKGFSGCVRYNCFGAGQRVTKENYAGKSWRDHPELAQEMFDTFSKAEKLHGLISMLEAAKKLNLSDSLEQQRARHQQDLESLSIAPGELKQLPLDQLRRKIEQFLSTLQQEVSPETLRQ
jgi:hypothetical protein